MQFVPFGASLSCPKWTTLFSRLDWAESMCQVRHQAPRPGAQAVYRSSRCDVKRAVILVAPGQVSGLLGQHNRAQMAALRVPNPNSLGPGDKQIAAAAEAHAIGQAVIRSAVLLADDA